MAQRMASRQPAGVLDPASSPARSVGWWLRRLIIAIVIGAQLAAVLVAYRNPHPIFGFQMFSEASSWQAEIYRITVTGDRLDVREDWPDYEWSQLVRARGLGAPFSRQHASGGLDSTFDFFQEALDWVAANTPLDEDTLWLEAEVTYWDNDRGPFQRTFRSIERDLS